VRCPNAYVRLCPKSATFSQSCSQADGRVSRELCDSARCLALGRQVWRLASIVADIHPCDLCGYLLPVWRGHRAPVVWRVLSWSLPIVDMLR
jgi:hypothetical protein